MARIAVCSPALLEQPQVTALLEARGHTLITTRDPSKILDRLLSDPPDILLLQKGVKEKVEIDLIQALKSSLQLTLMPIMLYTPREELGVGLDWDKYPVDDLITDDAPAEEVVARVTLTLARIHRVADNNPLTKLPGNSSILKSIQGILHDGRDHAVAYVDIDNFKPYNDKYGFARGDEVIRMVARILVNVIQERVGSQGFVGHVGGDDFVFISPLDNMDELCQAIIDNFTALIPLFLDEEDLEAGFFSSVDRLGKEQVFPLTSISIAVVPCRSGRFDHYGEVAAVAAQLKKKVKQSPGSNYLVDRRN